MKKIIAILSLVITFGAFADIDTTSAVNITPSNARIEKSRACFQELQTLGCGHPKDDLEQFRSCMNNVFESLDSNCQTMMKRLYGK